MAERNNCIYHDSFCNQASYKGFVLYISLYDLGVVCSLYDVEMRVVSVPQYPNFPAAIWEGAGRIKLVNMLTFIFPLICRSYME